MIPSTNPLQSASEAIYKLSRTLNNVAAAITMLGRLETGASAPRAQKASNVRVSNVQVITQILPSGGGAPIRVMAKTGDAGYTTRITFHPKQGIKCTCLDFQTRKMACKHVYALAAECRMRLNAILNIIDRDVERFSIQMESIEGSATILAATASESLANSLGALRS